MPAAPPPLFLPMAHRAAIARQAVERFPNECCGVLLGSEGEGQQRAVTELVAISNRAGASARRRYLLDPDELLRAEQRARVGGLVLLGIYHSHSDQPATPSEADRQAAWPGWSYVIIAVPSGRAGALRSWRLDSARRLFVPEELLPLAAQ